MNYAVHIKVQIVYCNMIAIKYNSSSSQDESVLDIIYKYYTSHLQTAQRAELESRDTYRKSI
jgi:hypothetical protein